MKPATIRRILETMYVAFRGAGNRYRNQSAAGLLPPRDLFFHSLVQALRAPLANF